MSRQQKCAWYNRGIPAWLSVLVPIPCGAATYFLVSPAAGAITLFVLLIGLSMFLSRRPAPGTVAIDERMEMLQHKAMWYGVLTTLYAVTLGFSALAFACVLQGKEAVALRLKDLSVIMLAGFCLFCIVTGVTYLVMRYRGECNGED